ncbi:syntaxin-binding protein 5-like, partial [Trifolium pratense]
MLGGNSSAGLRASDVDPRLIFHHGVPSGGTMFAYDNIHNILALSTNDGRIKLFGKDNTQVLLESNKPVPSKFFQVWDIDKKLLCDLYIVKEEITSFVIIQHSLYMYIGVSSGDISVLKLHQDLHVEKMNYTIPLSASFENEVFDDTVVAHILPQPAAETKRSGGSLSQQLHNETKKVSCACWMCPFGSKVAVGYSNGELYIWSIPSLTAGNVSASDHSSKNIPMFKFNLGYKSDKTCIVSVKWIYAEGKTSRLYVLGASQSMQVFEHFADIGRVVLLNEHTETRTIKLGLYLSELCVDMEIISSSNEQSKHKQNSLILLGKSGHVYLYDDSMIERYLLQCQSKSTPSLPKEVMVKLPLADCITIAKFISNTPNGFYSQDESENDHSLSGVPLTELYFDINTPLLVSGDQSGMVRIFRFKPEPYAYNSFMSLTGSTKKGVDHVIQSVKLIQTIGAVICMNIDHSSGHLAVGSDQGNVSVINIDGPTLLYQKHFASEISTGIISLQFITCSLYGFSKNILAVGTKDSSVLALDNETGNTLSTGTVHPKKPSKALFMQVLDEQGEPITKDSLYLREGNHIEDATTKKMYILLCSEKALYIYSFEHALQGIKKVLYKKKFSLSSCCWASTFHSASDIGLILLFTSGKVELRWWFFLMSARKWIPFSHQTVQWLRRLSLPELSLIVKTSIRGFTYSPPKLKSFSDSQICCSSRGEIVLVNSDQEISVVSLLVQRNIFRLLDSVGCVYRKERMLSQELVPYQVIPKEKKGIFNSVVKDFTGSKEKHMPLMEKEDPKESIQELSAIFSHANFPPEANYTVDENQLESNLDDTDLEHHREIRKEQSILGALNKKKLAGKFQALKGDLYRDQNLIMYSSTHGQIDTGLSCYVLRFVAKCSVKHNGKVKEMKGNNQKASDKEEQQDEKADAVNQIKKKYGFLSSSN